MFKILILLCLLYFLLSFALTGFTVFRYEGLFQNPNAQGRFSGITLCFFGLLLLTGRHYLQSSGWRILLILLVAISLITLLASNSRTPFISAAAAFLAFLGLQMLRFPWLEQKVTFIVQMFIIAFFVFVIIVFADYIGALDEFARKQVHTLERGDVSQGRLEMWENALPNLTWHGLPPGDFSRLDGLHSNYLSLSMNYGIFFAILYFSVFVFILFKSSWVYWLKGCNTSRSSAALCIFFLVYSLAEQGAAIFVVWMIVWLFGVSGQSSPRIASAREADPGSIGRFGQTV